MDLAGKRLGIFYKNDPSRDFGQFPHEGEGVRMFATIKDAFAYVSQLVAEGKRVRVFAAQNTLPPKAAPPGFVPEFAGEMSPDQVPFIGHYNFATLRWNSQTKTWEWEWVNDGHSNQLRRTPGLPRIRRRGTQPPFYVQFGVVEITPERARNACGLPPVPWEKPQHSLDDYHLDDTYGTPLPLGPFGP